MIVTLDSVCSDIRTFCACGVITQHNPRHHSDSHRDLDKRPLCDVRCC